MSSLPCCAVDHKLRGARIASGDPPPAASRQSARRGVAGLLFPSAILLLLPKCPACIALYVAMGSGIALSLRTATYLRMGIMALCLLMLGYFGVRMTREALRRVAH